MKESVRQNKHIGGSLLILIVALLFAASAGTGVAHAATAEDTLADGGGDVTNTPQTAGPESLTESDPAPAPEPIPAAAEPDPATADTDPATGSDPAEPQTSASGADSFTPDGDTSGTGDDMDAGDIPSTQLQDPAGMGLELDHNGDGLTELGVLYDYGNSNTGLWLFDPTGTGFAAPQVVWASGAGNWDWNRAKLVTTDHNGDGRTELTVLYDYGNSNTGLWIFDPTDTGYAAPRLTWSSGAGNWDWSRSKLVATDYNGDSSTELSVFYDYGNSNTGLWVFDPTPTGFAAPRNVWASGAGNWKWANSKLVASDVDGNGLTEIAILYNYGNNNAGLWLMDPTASGFSAPRLAWVSGAGNWQWTNSRLATTDHDGDGRTEISVLYHYGNSNTGLWVFEPNGTTYNAPQIVWASGAGNWDWTRSKLQVSDYNGDGRTELAVLYDYSNSNTGLWLFDPTPGGFASPRGVWASGNGNWNYANSKMPKSDSVKKTVVQGILYIDVNLSAQVVSAVAGVMTEDDGYVESFVYTVFSTLVSTGGPGSETPTGNYTVYSKNMYIDMSGPGYYAPNVPFVLWFTGPYSIHGTYWHNDFGWPHTHGCVNLPTPAAQWLWERSPVGLPVWVHY